MTTTRVAWPPLTIQDRQQIKLLTRIRCAHRPGMQDLEITEACRLAVALYATAASYGAGILIADAVTSFIDIAIDAIRARRA